MESFVEEKKEQEGVGQAAIAEQQRSVIFANNQAFGSDTWTETTKQTVVRILLREGKSNITELDKNQKYELMDIVLPKCHQGHTISYLHISSL